ncbi:hypothetical protein C3L33_18777, partial [Rhododendron williamsianum]
MEILYASLLGFFLLLVIYLFYNHKTSGNANLPPGKTGFPVIGETLEFLYAGWKGHSEKFISDRIAKYSSNVFKTSLFGSPSVVFCGVNGHQFLFSNENKLVRVWFPRSINKIFRQSTETFSTEEAINARKHIRTLIKPEGLQSHIGLMDTFAHCHFVTYWENKDMVLVFPLAKHCAFVLACRLLMSVEDPNLVAILENAIREALTDFTYNGFSIPKGWKLYWTPQSTHSNQELFPEPQKFDPSRFEGSGPPPYAYVPFGGGPRMCPGKEFARLEILVFMHHLVKRFRWEKQIPDEKIVYIPIASPKKGFQFASFPTKLSSVTI